MRIVHLALLLTMPLSGTARAELSSDPRSDAISIERRIREAKSFDERARVLSNYRDRIEQELVAGSAANFPNETRLEWIQLEDALRLARRPLLGAGKASDRCRDARSRILSDAASASSESPSEADLPEMTRLALRLLRAACRR